MTPPADPRYVPGALLAGRFRIETMLGRGGMGAVFGAVHLALGQRVAIKVLQGPATSDPDAIARFKQEAQIACRLDGPNVVRVHDLGQTDHGEPFIVMEMLSGCDLDRVIQNPASLPVAHAVDLVLQASTGVALAHAAGLVHRDLKPANLFLARLPTGGEIVKVLDFGLSKVLNQTDAGLTQSASSFGTPLYMSPEQIMSAKHVDERCDQHALAMILFELLAKKPPFQAESPGALTVKIVTQRAPLLRPLRPDVPTGLDDALQRAMAKNPAERFDDLGGFATAIAPFGGVSAVGMAREIVRSLAGREKRVAPVASAAWSGQVAVPSEDARTAGAFSRRGAGRSKSPSVLFWGVVSSLVTLAVVGTGALLVLRSRGASSETAGAGQPRALDSAAFSEPSSSVAPIGAVSSAFVDVTPEPALSVSASPATSSSSAKSTPPEPRPLVNAPANVRPSATNDKDPFDVFGKKKPPR